MTATSQKLEGMAVKADAMRPGGFGLDPTFTYSDFALRLDHASGGHIKARDGWEAYQRDCERLRRSDPLVFARAEVAGYEARIAEGLRALRVYVRLFCQTGDRVLYKENGIDFEKTAIRLWVERLAQARVNLEAQRTPA